MNFFFAPLEGITGYVYRNAHHQLFGDGIAAYYTPFVVSNYTKKLKTRERMDVLPENNRDTPIVPQILANNADEFLYTARIMADLGYREVNINLGCPVRTVVVKHKGSGMLQDVDALDRFLDGVYEGAEKILVDSTPSASSPADALSGNASIKAPADNISPVPLRVSVKTRIGFESVAEAPAIFKVYNRYPISKLIVHARTRQEQYAGQPHIEVFRQIMENCSLPLCYNGNINTVGDFRRLCAVLADRQPLPAADSRGQADKLNSSKHSRFNNAQSSEPVSESSSPDGSMTMATISPETELPCDVMIGRGLLADPGLVRRILTGQKTTLEELRAFHARLYEGYQQQYASFHSSQSSGETVVINRMKEIWTHMGESFDDQGRYLKNIHKARNRVEYEAAVRMLFGNCALKEPAAGLH